MSPGIHPPTRHLPAHPDLAQLRRQAKELLKAFAARETAAIAEVESHFKGASAATFTLQHAQLVLARAYGFDSWPKLKAYVDGITVRRLVDAVLAGDFASVTSMLSVRPELVHLDLSPDDEHQALHHAVLQRQPEIVRLLMRYGADARKGIYPHRDATSPLTLASERGYDEIVEIITEAERTRRSKASDVADNSDPAESFAPPEQPERPLTAAVLSNQPEVLRSLLASGFDPDERERVGGLEDVVYSYGSPLRECAIGGHVEMAEMGSGGWAWALGSGRWALGGGHRFWGWRRRHVRKVEDQGPRSQAKRQAPRAKRREPSAESQAPSPSADPPAACFPLFVPISVSSFFLSFFPAGHSSRSSNPM